MHIFRASDKMSRLHFDNLYGPLVYAKTLPDDKLLALTLTISRDNWIHVLQKDLEKAIGYFKYIITELGYDGYWAVGVLEYTVKDVPHLHCIVQQNGNDLSSDNYKIVAGKRRSNGNYITVSNILDNRIDVVHYIQIIRDGVHLRNVVKYITKRLPPLSMLTFLQQLSINSE